MLTVNIHKVPYFNLSLVMLLVGFSSLIVNVCLYSKFSTQHILYAGGLLVTFISYSFWDLIFYLNRGKQSPVSIHSFRCDEYFLRIYIILGSIGAIIAVFLMFYRGELGPGGFFFNLRYFHTVEILSSYGSSHLSLLSLLSSILLMLKKENKLSVLMLLISIIPPLSNIERTGILYSLTFYLFFYLKTHGQNLKVIGKYVVIFLIIAVVMSFMTNKERMADEFFLIPYFSYGLQAFEDRLLGATIEIPAFDVFGVFGTIADKLLNREVSYNLYDSGMFNVYTYVFKPYYLLGGYGFFILMAVLGFCLFIIEQLANKSIYFLCINASLLFSATMVFFDWTFNLTTHIYIALAAIPLFLRFRFT